MRTVDPAKHEARRRQILAAATRCFARKGFGQTRTADICAEAGMSSGNLFHYFESKHAIFAAIVEQDGIETDALFAELSTMDPWAALTAFFDLLVDLADDEYAKLALEISAEANRDERIAELVTANDRTLRAGLAALVERATAAGRIEPGVDADTAATWLTVLVDGLFNRVAVDPSFAPKRERETLRQVVARVLQAN
ncbi:DNA-binding transcriptional regulator, AcrR family [Actinokineospora alba]|uniref:DNA-binding transcriptional regulator, AcrR family n=1 Tax=Actinokineospora alba TaxID=504798 RepID=A0A1H0I7S3_9PSEU|nr:TetR/AcrR family transcriptional regulator [Actinokineospora alba]TDP64564.1 TetR family transcriptional regulator [Actinokineospora alba]SDI87081.1 DNA-binding transcriptional regulator, AcrR family [Actinokineospora alba]SDO27447.1 DNA-binding transcriptional regulator, AcrR family [Actinokineospora alba]